ncbi:gamma-glutamyltransferase [Dyadobacter bucti]|uniref:gamma-glutamyltransferase n=1 Tax=Dyadobacter bucti TaxID=2572203 RepID=UPI0035B5D280
MIKLNNLKLLLVFLMAGNMAAAQFRFTGRSFATRSETIARNGMAATSQPLASQVAIDILKKGGSAVDAAIAANAVLGLVEPTGNGIGGDLFAIVWDAKAGKLVGLNASGRSPKSMTLDYLKEKGMKNIPGSGALSVSVPGCVDGWYELHAKYGKLPMKDLLTPAIQYAREGFPVSEVIAAAWRGYASRLHVYENYKKLYMPGGNTPAKGEIFQNPDLANTLEKIMKEGKDAFYKGAFAKTIEATVKKEGGFLSAADLAAHRSDWVQPVSTNYRGYDVWELPPNGQGIAVLQMLNILEGYDLAAYGFGSAEHIHLLTEAKKLAFEDRSEYIADPAFGELPVAELISKKYAAERRKLIDMNRAGSYTPGVMEVGSNTIYLTTADKDGNMVSFIQSNFAGMGSGIVPEGLGFSLQNRGSSFNLEPGHPNSYVPGKRPFHTLIPAFITKDGKPFVSFGVMGADMQPQGHVQIVVNLIDFKMNLQEAGDAPRVSHAGSSSPTGGKSGGSGNLRLENGFSPDTILKLLRMGHKTGYDMGGFGGYQAIMFDEKNKVYYGASESRKDGYAAGY